MPRSGEEHTSPEVVAADFAAHREAYAIEHSQHGPVRARQVRLTPGIVGTGIVGGENEGSEYDPMRSIMSQALEIAARTIFGESDNLAAEQRAIEREMDLQSAEELRH